jgi:signal transduction histidine kinase
MKSTAAEDGSSKERTGETSVAQDKPIILVVVEDPETNRFIGEILSQEYRVISAHNGQEGWKQARAARPTIIVTEIMMRRISGPDMIAQLRQHPELANVPILLLAAKTEEELKTRLLQEGVQDFVTTPFSEIDLRVRARNLIERVQAQQELVAVNERLAKASKELEARVEERTAAMREAVAQLEEFAYTVAHDLRGPLYRMQTYCEIVLKDGGELLASKPDSIRHLKRISENANRLETMIRDLLTFSRIARGEVRIERVAVEKLVRELVQRYQQMLPPRADVQIAPLDDVLGHEPLLTQVFSNLLLNAVKFVAPGAMPTVRVWSEKRDREVRLWIEDNGIGIDPRFHHRLFRVFERIHPELSYEGNGIGLAIVRKATERMHGTVGVESDGTTGSKFWIQLPAP